MSTLGCASTLEVFISSRSGQQFLYKLPHTKVSWERTLDSTSKADVEVGGVAGVAYEECCDEIADFHCWAHSITVRRDGRNVWSGPITDMEFDDNGVSFKAEDVSAWLSRRRVHSRVNYEDTDLVTIFNAIVEDAISVDNEFGLITDVTPSGVYGSRDVKAAEYKMADKELSELARTGVDWTVVNRTMYIGGQELIPSTNTPTLTDDHIVSPSKVRELGEIETEVNVLGNGKDTQGASIVGTVTNADAEVDYGVHESVVTEDRIRDAQSAVAAAQTRLDIFRKPPTIFSGGRLSEEAPFALEDLIPGLTIPVLILHHCRRISGNYRLQKVKYSEDGGDEQVEIDVQPMGTINEEAS